VFAVIGGLHLGRGDPTFRRESDGTFWRGIRTPQGAATLCLGLVAGSAIEATAWGPGAQWALGSVPAMLGDLDDVSDFVAHHRQVAEAARRFSGWRVPRTGLVLEALIPSIIAQKVTGQEASGSYRTLVRRFGERAPGEGGVRGLWVAPSARGWALIPSWEWLRAGVDGARSASAVRAAGAAGRLEQCVELTPSQAQRRLQAVPGIGVWTAAEVRHTALGDSDAVSFGDYHVAKDIGWALRSTTTAWPSCSNRMQDIAIGCRGCSSWQERGVRGVVRAWRREPTCRIGSAETAPQPLPVVVNRAVISAPHRSLYGHSGSPTTALNF
jgi:3-methyladenine DNA glycosylase/8-oxoguanine DNA glycosylase